jgi:hypothetical protein
MGIDIDVHKIPNNKGIAAVMLLFSSMICPSWFIYQFNPTLFFKIDFPTKLLLSAGVGFLSF